METAVNRKLGVSEHAAVRIIPMPIGWCFFASSRNQWGIEGALNKDKSYTESASRWLDRPASHL